MVPAWVWLVEGGSFKRGFAHVEERWQTLGQKGKGLEIWLCCPFAEDSLCSLRKAVRENEYREKFLEWESKEDAEDKQAMSVREVACDLSNL